MEGKVKHFRHDLREKCSKGTFLNGSCQERANSRQNTVKSREKFKLSLVPAGSCKLKTI